MEEGADKPTFDSFDDDDHESEHEEVTYGDEGEALVVQHILKFVHIEDDEWLHHNIFHTKCTSHGKVCIMIIDNRSYENLFSTTMVEKLQLKMKNHPKPYKSLLGQDRK